MLSRYTNLQIVATTLRDIKSASRHDVGGVCFADGEVFEAASFRDVDVLDRVGSGDAFAAGLIYGLLNGKDVAAAINLSTASAILAMASAGDGLSATLAEIERLAANPEHTAIR